MKILIVHNSYRLAGGEDSVVASETELLRDHGHFVTYYCRNNEEVSRKNLAVGLAALWSIKSYCEVKSALDESGAEIVHVHNTFPLISPSIFWAAQSRGIPVVQTLHNFRTMCIQAMLRRDGSVCEDCIGRSTWRGVSHRCYRNSLPESAVAAASLEFNRLIGSDSRVTLYIALNQFCRSLYTRGGIPEERIRVKPNFVAPPHETSFVKRSGGLYVGRLSEEKGVSILARALVKSSVPVNIVGDGPLKSEFTTISQAKMEGWLDAPGVSQCMRKASYLILPSVWYEAFPRVLVESFAHGLPIIASRIGALAELIEEGETGLLFSPGSATELAECLNWAECNPEAMVEMGLRAQNRYKSLYSPSVNYEQLMKIYREAIEIEKR